MAWYDWLNPVHNVTWLIRQAIPVPSLPIPGLPGLPSIPQPSIPQVDWEKIRSSLVPKLTLETNETTSMGTVDFVGEVVAEIPPLPEGGPVTSPTLPSRFYPLVGGWIKTVAISESGDNAGEVKSQLIPITVVGGLLHSVYSGSMQFTKPGKLKIHSELFPTPLFILQPWLKSSEVEVRVALGFSDMHAMYH